MTLAGRTVLVTGGTGFIGGRLVEKLVLEQRARVRVLVRSFSSAARVARFPVELVRGDMTDAAAVATATQGCEVVFHCAHQRGQGKKRHIDIAVQATRNVGEAVLRSGVARMVHVSSFAVYGPTPDGDLTESSRWQPIDNSYIGAKREAERLLNRLYQRQGLPVVILQPTIVYGPYCRPWTLRPVEDVKTSRVALFNGGAGYCNAVYVDDVVDAMVLAAVTPGAVGETFLVSGSEPITWKSFWAAFETAVGIVATAGVSEREFTAIVARQTRRTGAALQLLRLLTDPRTTARLKAMMPAVGASVELLNRQLRRQRVRRLLSFVSAKGLADDDAAPGRPPLRVPEQAWPELYQSRTRVRIDKAEAWLGYRPRFDFERGMDLTVRYLRWARVV